MLQIRLPFLLLPFVFRDRYLNKLLENENTSVFYLFNDNLTFKIDEICVNVHIKILWNRCQHVFCVFKNQGLIKIIYSCCEMLVLVI